MKIDKKLDFIIIGSQKAGTTFLASVLNSSTEIFIPEEKELPFYLNGYYKDISLDEFIKLYFMKASNKQLLATSTPQYMIYPETFKKIKEDNPNIKIIVILRNPIERLISHYDMSCRQGKEIRNINEVINEQLNNIEYYRDIHSDDTTSKYVVAGEYGRILLKLLEDFELRQIHILSFFNLTQNVEKEIKKIETFLNVKNKITNFYTKSKMEGGKKKIININHEKIIRKISEFMKKLKIYKFIPFLIKKKIRIYISLIDNINSDKNTKSSIKDIDNTLLLNLQKHYKEDFRKLKGIINIDLNIDKKYS